MPAKTATNPLLRLTELGQSVWLDHIERDFVANGALAQRIREDGLRGLTSNPVIFERAMADGEAYRRDIASLASEGLAPIDIYETMALADVRAAADVLRPIHDRLDGTDGFVSFEVSPHLARDAAGSVRSARALWRAIDRPNVFIKIPATVEGLTAIRQLTSDGINVNVTLLFGLPRYREVVDAWLGGLEDRVARGEPIDHVHSVASFFLSRVDVAIDPLLARVAEATPEHATRAAELRGTLAVASAKLAHEIFREVGGSERASRLREAGAHPQRLLWASTGTKNAEDFDLKYVEPLVGPGTVNTMPPKTFEAYRDHGDPVVRLEDGVAEAHAALATLADVGISIDEVTARLVEEGIEKFVAPFDALVESLASHARALR